MCRIVGEKQKWKWNEVVALFRREMMMVKNRDKESGFRVLTRWQQWMRVEWQSRRVGVKEVWVCRNQNCHLGLCLVWYFCTVPEGSYQVSPWRWEPWVRHKIQVRHIYLGNLNRYMVFAPKILIFKSSFSLFFLRPWCSPVPIQNMQELLNPWRMTHRTWRTRNSTSRFLST